LTGSRKYTAYRMAMGGNNNFLSLLDQAQVIAEFFLEGRYTDYIHDHIISRL
jgi:hypothetical protein